MGEAMHKSEIQTVKSWTLACPTVPDEFMKMMTWARQEAEKDGLSPFAHSDWCEVVTGDDEIILRYVVPGIQMIGSPPPERNDGGS